MRRARLNLFIEPEHARRLDELATKKGVSKSSLVAAALASWLSPASGEQREVSNRALIRCRAVSASLRMARRG